MTAFFIPGHSGSVWAGTEFVVLMKYDHTWVSVWLRIGRYGYSQLGFKPSGKKVCVECGVLICL